MSLDRFLKVQAQTYPVALAEIRNGKKMTHWMWFIFPQLASLGRSQTSEIFGISDGAEAAAYLAHPVLGTRLIEISRAMMQHEGTPPIQILGKVDALKLRSSATLFAAQSNDHAVFDDILGAFYGGTPCPLTLKLLSRE
ncbi:DUF1810 domain-containing protein [Primorskyibacter flagellatus]|uniref:Uncharacterized protein, DUF1810 family n=1 Tax=Primorskyibacter flagellatus TaxID=1387277 RepID=A0A1W2CVM7_9RHOB|nr:DUF1810 domain-containing protein [Primorskyibacter flagellatus]SMC89283.1 Uncharacterized protein, DUF1810 family [Primorskyibacter flagellatus]